MQNNSDKFEKSKNSIFIIPTDLISNKQCLLYLYIRL